MSNITSFPATSTLVAGQALVAGQSIRSPNGQYEFVYQSDGNVVLYDNYRTALWSSNTWKASAGKLVMQDGELVLFNGSNVILWRAGRAGPGYAGSHLRVTDDGNLVLHAPDGGVLWSRNPAQPLPALAPTPTPVPAASFPESSTLKTGDALFSGQSRRSPNGKYEFIHQSDNNVVLYSERRGVLWASNTASHRPPLNKMFVQDNGDLTLANEFSVLWTASANNGKTSPAYRGSHLRVTDDGNLIVYTPDGSVVWSIKPAPPLPASAPAK